MEYYSAIKKNEIGLYVETWMGLHSVRKKKTNTEYHHVYVESGKMVQMKLFAKQK